MLSIHHLLQYISINNNKLNIYIYIYTSYWLLGLIVIVLIGFWVLIIEDGEGVSDARASIPMQVCVVLLSYYFNNNNNNNI